MTQTAHTKECPTQVKPPRKPGKCTCGVARDKWLKDYADLKRATRMENPLSDQVILDNVFTNGVRSEAGNDNA